MRLRTSPQCILFRCEHTHTSDAGVVQVLPFFEADQFVRRRIFNPFSVKQQSKQVCVQLSTSDDHVTLLAFIGFIEIYSKWPLNGL